MSGVILDFFLFSGFIIALLISAGEFVQKDKSLVDYLFAASFLGLSFWYIQLGLFATGVFSDLAVNYYIILAISPIAFIVSPLMVNRYLWIISNKYNFKKKYLTAFIPALFSLLLVAVPLFYEDSRFTDYSMFYGCFFSDAVFNMPLYFRIFYLIIPLECLFLITMMMPVLVGLFPIIKIKHSPASPNTAAMGYLFAALITASNVLAMAGALFSIPLLKIAIVCSNFSMISVYLVTQRHPDYIRLLKSITRKHQYEKSQIIGLDLKQILSRLFELMEDEKLYVDEDLSMPVMARELGVSSHQLSELLNKEIKKNFNSFVNEYRVKEAKELLIEQPERSILSVGVGAGFNSTTTFNSVFSKLEGVSPGKFRKMNLANKERIK